MTAADVQKARRMIADNKLFGTIMDATSLTEAQMHVLTQHCAALDDTSTAQHLSAVRNLDVPQACEWARQNVKATRSLP